MKRFFLILLAIVTVLAAFPACTPETPPADTTDGVNEGTTVGEITEAPTEAPTEMTTAAPETEAVKGGCGGVVTVSGGVLLTAIATAVACGKRKA